MASREGTASPEDAASAAGSGGKAESGPVSSKDPDLRIENGRVKSGTLVRTLIYTSLSRCD